MTRMIPFQKKMTLYSSTSNAEHGTRRALRIGLTGNIACGKSTVGAMLVAHGAEYLDADRLVHALMEPRTAENDRIVERFGPSVRAADGRINRAALGDLVWHDPAALKDLEAILHPGVRAELRHRMAESRAPALVVDAIKLIESGLYRELDAVWVVTCAEDEQLRRLTVDRGLTLEEARVRIAAQSPQQEKICYASVIIDNSGPRSETERQVDAAWRHAITLQSGLITAPFNHASGGARDDDDPA